MVQPWSVLNTQRSVTLLRCSDRRRGLREITDLSSIPARVPQVPRLHQNCVRAELNAVNCHSLRFKCRATMVVGIDGAFVKGVDLTVVSPAANLRQEHSFLIPNTKA